MEDVQEVDGRAEAEGRLLLAAATETIAGGGDLLGGLRRRRVRRRRRIRVAMSGGLAVAVGAGAVLALTGTGPATHAAAPSARAQLTASLTATGARSYRISAISEEVQVATSGKRYAIISHDTGAFDPSRQVGEDTVSGSALGGAGQYRYIGKFQYERLDVPESNHGKPWLRSVPDPQSSALDAGVGASSGLAVGLADGDGEAIAAGPAALAPLINSLATVREIGPVSGPGWTGVRYTFTATVRYSNEPSKIVNGSVDVDQQGLVRRMEAGTISSVDFAGLREMGSATEITFGSFGTPVRVVAPPASQIQDGSPPPVSGRVAPFTGTLPIKI
jgi:hypothetical protein